MVETMMKWENQHLNTVNKKNTFFCLLFVKALWEDLLRRPIFNVIYLPSISVLRHVCKLPKLFCLCI